MPSAPLVTAEIIAVGSELLGPTRVDTNSLFLSDQLASLGIELRAKSVVGDDRRHLAAMFTAAAARADLVILTGGLGPTDDDLTREVVAGALGLELIEDPAIVAWLEDRFARRGLQMPSVNRRQAMVPRGASVLENPNGSAPGLFIETVGDMGSRVVILLPGPPRELQPMMQALCAGRLQSRAGRERAYKATVFIAGRGESHVEEIVQPIYSRWTSAVPPIETTILSSPGLVELHLTLRSAEPDAARGVLDAARAELVAVLGNDVFSTDGLSLEEKVGQLLRDRRLTIAAAESCTGGLLMARLTDVPGSSAYVMSGVVTYSDDSKTTLAGVPRDLLQAHGAVSEAVAVALADGIRERAGASLGVGITGVAGPGGGTERKPVGTVAVAVVGLDINARVRTFHFPGGRAHVRHQATQAALDMVRRALTTS